MVEWMLLISHVLLALATHYREKGGGGVLRAWRAAPLPSRFFL